MTTETVRLHATAADDKVSDAVSNRLVVRLWLRTLHPEVKIKGWPCQRMALFKVPANRMERFAEHAADLKIRIEILEPK